MADEKRLMDATKVLERADEVTFMGFRAEERKKHFMDLISSILMQCTTVDAVEVVRCKDCKHRGEEGECPMYFVTEIEWDYDGYTECDYVPYDRTVDDGFCDRGERGEA